MRYTITLHNRREFNAVLAGLRSLQISVPAQLKPILNDGVKESLTPTQIDDLCERINTFDTEVAS